MLQHPKETIDALYNAAVHYASDLGWKVIPVSLKSKVPLLAWRAKEYTLDDIEEWFDRGVRTQNGQRITSFNLAICTGSRSGVVVVDADNQDAIKELERLGLHSPLTAKTKKGRHFYFRYPGYAVANVSQSPEGIGWNGIEGVDVRGDGGIVLVAPSVRYDEDGSNPVRYEWEGSLNTDELLHDIPSWNDIKIDRVAGVEVGQEASSSEADQIFAALDLSTVKKAASHNQLTIWDETAAAVAEKGKIQEGAGRNYLMVRFAGQQVRRYRKYGDALDQVMREFQDRFYEEPLEEHEISKIKRSAVSMDQRKFPEDYDNSGDRIQPEKIDEGNFFSMKNLKSVREKAGVQRFLINPFLRERQIMMVYGYTGHGKSNFTLATLYAAACGKSWGPFDVWRAPKTLYFDFENGLTTILDRLEDLERAFGDAGDNLLMWDRMVHKGGEDLNLRTKDGIARLFKMVELKNPDVVVLDTVRSGWIGLEENNAREWADVNRVARHIRDVLGAAVILIHHSNKPRMDDQGRIIGGTESGSTAQLNDVETQVRVTLCVEDEQTAFSKRAKSGAAKTPAEIGIAENEVDAAFKKLRSRLRSPDDTLMFVYEISYEKVRMPTSNHSTVFVGAAEDPGGNFYWVGTDSPRQRVVKAYKMGLDESEIRDFLSKSGNRVIINGKGIVNTEPLTLGIKQIKGWLQSEQKRENTA